VSATVSWVNRGSRRRSCVYLTVATLLAAGAAQAQSAAPKDDSSLTWNGITLYGIVDIGLQYLTHGAPISDYFPAGTSSIIQKNSNASVTGLTPSNLSQSRIGLSGLEPLNFQDISFVFRLETFFNPQSGNLSDGLKSMVLNNGRPLDKQGTNVDTSVAGQLFAGAAYAGFSSPTFGSLTFGRHVTPLADGIAKYDPLAASQAFSVIGFSGTGGGGGDTEDRRLDQSVKYSAKFGPVHVGALYQFNGSNGASNTAEQAQLGLDFLGGGSVDAYYAKKKDAVASSPLSSEQVAGLAGLCNPPATLPPTPSQCYSVSNSLSATISDNTTFSIMALYNFGAPKIFAGYEHIKFENPNTPLPQGFITIGGYQLAYVNNDAYAVNKTLEVFWAGAKYALTPDLEFTLAYYGYHQDAFATGAEAGCSSNISAKCSGNLNAVSGVVDYRFTKRFDVYFGSMWSGVKDGLANGYTLNRDTVATTAGLRFKF
jgi:predicted porin